MRNLQTLLTGFGPFGGVVSNPTERLIAHFATEEVPDHTLTLCTLPVSFAHAQEVMQTRLDAGGEQGVPFDLVLMLGVAAGSPGWRVERFGRNANNAIADADGFMPPAEVILPEAPESLPVHFPVETVVSELEAAGLPAFPSDSAGGYLCNYILFTTLHTIIRDRYPAHAGFLHVPADELTYTPATARAPLFTFEQQILAVRVTLRVLAEWATPHLGEQPSGS